MVSALQSFTSSTIASTINYARRAMDGKLAKDDRKASASALANMVITQTALAGVMGLPGVGVALWLAEKTLGYDLQAELSELAAKADDPETAAQYNQIAMRGLSRAIQGPDLGARYGLGNVMGLNENDGFAFENMFGPVGSFLGRSVVGLGKLAKGDVLGATAEVAPVAVRKPLKLWSDEWQFRSKDGNLLLENTTATERAMYALGMQPHRLSAARESYNMIKRAREREHQDEIKWSRDIADSVQAGDTESAKQLIATKAQEDGTSYQDLVERVAKALEVREFRAQPTQGGTKSTADLDAALAVGYGQGAPVDELKREEFKAEITQLLGVAPNAKRLREAAVIDEMRRKNPFLTVRQAKILLENQRRKSSSQQAGLSLLMGQGL
jgi:hypothetical protein